MKVLDEVKTQFREPVEFTEERLEQECSKNIYQWKR